MTHRPILRLLLFICALTAVFSSDARANWVATGTFRYEDREFDEAGYTGAQPPLPIRFAKVEIRDLNSNGGQQLLATGATDSAGGFSINVIDGSTKVRSIIARVISDSSPVAGLYLVVTNVNGTQVPYAVSSAAINHSNPNLNLNLGVTTAMMGAGGEVFNLYDVAYNSVDYLRFLNGAYPGSTQGLAVRWEVFSGNTVTQYLPGREIKVGDPAAYSDTVIAHESGHYAREVYSATDSPGGTHRLSVCTQDLRLAWEEGWATYFGQAVRKHFVLPNPQLYVKMTAAAGAGNLDFYFDVETEIPFSCDGAASEVTVYAALWDVIDSAATPDGTPGLDEEWDFMGSPETMVWNVMKNYVRTATNRTLEDFWDGWFQLGLGSLPFMQEVFANHVVNYFESPIEPNETVPAASPISTNGFPVSETYFRNAGNGSGMPDVDYFRFDADVGTTYTIETGNLMSDANTSLVLYAPDGVSPLASNDDVVPGTKWSRITFLAPATGTYYVKSFHGAGWGAYGSYEISVTGNVSTAGGGAEPPPSPGPRILHLPVDMENNPRR